MLQVNNKNTRTGTKTMGVIAVSLHMTLNRDLLIQEKHKP